MNAHLILKYLSDLRENNNREWYHAHKNEYKEADAEFEKLLGELISRIGEFDGGVIHNSPKDLTFRLNRDTRFGSDKSPYNPAFRAHISSAGKLPIPVGYYVMIKPDNMSFLGGGLFADTFKDATAMVRNHIANNGAEWEEIIGARNFRRYFTVSGTPLKNVPAGYDKNHPQAEYLKFKSWYLEYPIEDPEFDDAEKFLARAADIFRAMKPFNDFLNKALDGFEMPPRK